MYCWNYDNHLFCISADTAEEARVKFLKMPLNVIGSSTRRVIKTTEPKRVDEAFVVSPSRFEPEVRNL